MAIPSYQTLMRPILRLHGDDADHQVRGLVEAMSDLFGLSPDERAELTGNGKQTAIYNRVTWATTYMFQAGLLERTGRGLTRITKRGHQVLADHPERVDNSVLAGFPEFVDFMRRSRKTKDGGVTAPTLSETDSPPEAIAGLVTNLHTALADLLVDKLRRASPTFLEHCVLDLLVRMGYGGLVGDVSHVGGPGDGGVDGMIKSDPLGLDVVYIQVKRYGDDHPVQRAEIQAFVGALAGKQADRGIFITTGRFTEGARRYADGVPARLVLIDGADLGGYMVGYGCGVRVSQTIEIKELDEDFFGEL